MLHGVSILALSDISKSFPGVMALDSLETINELRPQGVRIIYIARSKRVYQQRFGLCLETQLRPGAEYRSRTVCAFSTK